jgi:hypothetical protein
MRKEKALSLFGLLLEPSHREEKTILYYNKNSR